MRDGYFPSRQEPRCGDLRAFEAKITAMQTGTGNPPTRLIASPQNIGTLRRRLGIVFCRERTGPHPINGYLIDHAEGLILVDTGDTARKSDRGYMPRLNPGFRNIDIRVAPEEEIDQQLNAMGIRSADVRLVVLTHLHHDHTRGSPLFSAQPNPCFCGRLQTCQAQGQLGRRDSRQVARLV